MSVFSNREFSHEDFLHDVPREMPCVATCEFSRCIPNKMPYGSNGELLCENFSGAVLDETLGFSNGEFSQEKFYGVLPEKCHVLQLAIFHVVFPRKCHMV